ncbi:hypothetical protein WT81_27690 [Burkholderia stagnalis]|nr:hypothetical protein [Burkholderia stagnalis]KWK48203.1 hypothetical protein WT80_17875 [Burkholderia stagnalis]KWK51549.1 hypothetical protein WT81_27690 [Burkholderia stagnalis]
MADVDHISDSAEYVSLVLSSIGELADLLHDMPATTLFKPYAALTAFKLLADAAADKLADVECSLNRELLPLKRDMDAASKALGVTRA